MTWDESDWPNSAQEGDLEGAAHPGPGPVGGKREAWRWLAHAAHDGAGGGPWRGALE